jgi:hypothetical protein
VAVVAGAPRGVRHAMHVPSTPAPYAQCCEQLQTRRAALRMALHRTVVLHRAAARPRVTKLERARPQNFVVRQLHGKAAVGTEHVGECAVLAARTHQHHRTVNRTASTQTSQRARHVAICVRVCACVCVRACVFGNRVCAHTASASRFTTIASLHTPHSWTMVSIVSASRTS